MDYLPTLGEKWPHSRGNVGKYSLDGASGNDLWWLLFCYTFQVFTGFQKMPGIDMFITAARLRLPKAQWIFQVPVKGGIGSI